MYSNPSVSLPASFILFAELATISVIRSGGIGCAISAALTTPVEFQFITGVTVRKTLQSVTIFNNLLASNPIPP
ncbi:hypothetical protein [Paenibacillus phytorum]|uniref:hypothetical protein n=1 Tax=Paenibacillus phytorum TaxID=2654977 RepID=UPI001FE24470|nr:hypothetical protein [Paenibacillus phytorum]